MKLTSHRKTLGMSSKLETKIPPVSNLNGMMNDTIVFSINFQINDKEKPCYYRPNDDLSSSYKDNHSNGKDVSNVMKDSVHRRQMMKIPMNIMPPPPHKMLSNNISNNVNRSFDNRENSKTRHNVRSASPKEFESDENCSFPSRITPPDSGVKYKSARNGMGRLGEQTVMFGKFSHSSPNMLLYHGNGNYNNKNRYYNNGNRPKQQHVKNCDVIVRRAHGLMERFKSRSYLMRIDPNPPELLTGGHWDLLNQAIWDVFSSKAQTEDTYIKKLNLWRSVFLCFRKFLDSYGLFLVGSTMSGFGLENSDIDICLLIKPCISGDPRLDSVRYLEHLKNGLLKNGVASEAEVIHAKVPILKFKDPETNFEIDLNCNNAVGIRNTHLLNCYARLDWRVRPLVIIVKLWAQANNINDAKNMTISSYSWTLMVIHFLQCAVSPPVLPCLHLIAPDKFNSDMENQSMDVQEEMEGLREYKSDNKHSLGELLIGFLRFYSCFEYEGYAVSVRAGAPILIDDCRVMRAPKNDPSQWKYLCIEEPFDYTNTARSVFDLETFRRIKDIIQCSYSDLVKTKSLNSILPVSICYNNAR